MTKKLEEIRKEIDMLDEKIIPLLEKRFSLLDPLVPFKPTLRDKKREEEILKKTSSESVKKIYQEIFLESQKQMLKNPLHHFSLKNASR